MERQTRSKVAGATTDGEGVAESYDIKRLEAETKLEKMRRTDERLREASLRDHEFRLKELELRAQQTRETPSNTALRAIERTNFFAKSLKHLLGPCPTDIRDVPAYFVRIEKIFDNHDVDWDIRANLLMMNLNDGMKSWLDNLSGEDMRDYAKVKQHLLREYRINPVRLRDEFFAMRRQKEESFVMFAHRLHNTLQFYLQNREVDSFQSVVNLICANRLKELLQKNVLEFVLTQEMDDWMDYERTGATDVIRQGISQDFVTENRHQPTKRILKREVTSKPKWLHVITNASQQGKVPRVIQADKFYERSYVDVMLNDTLNRKALIDSGAEVCCISEDLCESLNLPLEGKLMVRGLEPEGKEVDGVWINLKPIPGDERCRVMAPAVKVWCAVIPGLVEGLLITPGVVELLNEVKHYEVPSPVNDDDEQRVGEAMSDCDVEEWSNRDGDGITDEVGRGEGLIGTDNGIDEEGHDEAINADANEFKVRKIGKNQQKRSFIKRGEISRIDFSTEIPEKQCLAR
ncbi:hypothetical protein HELRODRAFT_179049 [Helobdella robusta]|uniref:Retrotransposon gag domain-containing protein n=1 Tax=Helobdella robusta TaxID=6412 RepID=T1FE37_HELRO|nr:hypothetical protein HELRODRAFT_179049 [Helobdella robusta]ESN95856.1 hypothetical protein HELRODRAFT_179049 [Helobdella robusta]